MSKKNILIIVSVLIVLSLGAIVVSYFTLSSAASRLDESQSKIDSLTEQLNTKNDEIKTLADDKSSRQWILEAQDTLIIGEYGHNFAYDGNKVRPVEGIAMVDVNTDTNTGSAVIELKNVKHQFSADEVIEGDVRIVMEEFEGAQPFKQGAIAENLYLHGDSGNGPPVMPKLFTFLAGWGTVDIYVDGEKEYEDLDAHIMYTEGARVNNKVMKADGTVYNPKLKSESGFTDSSKREFHIVAHSTDEDKDNFPPNSRWIHLNFQEVALKKAPADAVLFVPS